MKARHFSQAFCFVVFPLAVLVACGSAKNRTRSSTTLTAVPSASARLGSRKVVPQGSAVAIPSTAPRPRSFKTYVGCDYWPTQGGNAVADVFDFAVAVANVGTDTANVTITGPNGVNKKITVKGGSSARCTCRGSLR